MLNSPEKKNICLIVGVLRWKLGKMETGKDFTKLRELLLLEEFKKCLPNEIKTKFL